MKMRTPREIAEHYSRHQKDDLLGFTGGVLVSHLPFDLAQPFLKPSVTSEEWGPLPLVWDAVLAEMREYMAFAWEKALNHRGISASRSVEKMRAWLFMLGDDELAGMERYENYGAPILLAICKKYGFLVPNELAAERMARGLPCTDGCDEGCGR